MRLARKFHRPTFIRSEVTVLTNRQTDRQTDAAENIQRCSLHNDGCVTSLQLMMAYDDDDDYRYSVNPFNASCSKLLLFEGFSAILV